jgi:hypothetical protein
MNYGWAVVANSPEELILPAMYNLYKIYQITNNKAEAMKNRINSQFSLCSNHKQHKSLGLNLTYDDIIQTMKRNSCRFRAVRKFNQSVFRR